MSTDPGSAATVKSLPAAALIAVDAWGDTPAALARIGAALTDGWRTIRVEPTVWWFSGPLPDTGSALARIVEALGEDGAATDLSGGFEQLEVSGPGWRTALMFGGVFDAEDPAFGVGATAGTLLHNTAVRYDVTRADAVEIYVAPSYAEDLLHHLSEAARAL